MTWPNATDYNAAVQNPQLCFRDEDLRQGQAVGDLFGLPRPHSGNFADVYQIQSRDGPSWAAKCFTRTVAGLRPRYHAISEHLRQTQLAFMVEFHFLDEGICIRGQWHPLVKMRWVEGLRLNEFVREHSNKPVILDRLAQLWVRLAEELRDAGMAHGDLQHGNVLLVPGNKNSSMALRLIDYDGMFVPSLADRPSGEVGHPHYQHPRRLREGGYGPDMDSFSQLLIYTALRCLRSGGEDLWQRHDNAENLLFREEDFRLPNRSRLLRELWEMPDREVRSLVGHLLLASQQPLDTVPMLDKLVDDSGIRPLSDREEGKINDLLNVAAAHLSRDRKGAEGIPLPHGRGSAVVLSADTLADTKPISLGVKTAKLPPPLPQPSRRSSTEIALDAEPPALPPDDNPHSEIAALTDPLVSFLSHPAWLATLGILALVSFLAVNVMVWSSVNQHAETAPVIQRPALADIDDVVLQGGTKKTISFHVNRHGSREWLTLRVEGLPDEMKAPSLTFPVDADKTSLTLLPPLDLGLSQSELRASLWDGDDKISEKTFHLSIHKVPRPRLQARDNLVCQPGQSSTVAIGVHRNGCHEPLLVRLEGLPSQIRQESVRAAEAVTPSLKLIVAADLAPESIPVKLSLHVGDVVADSKAMLLSIREEKVIAAAEQQPRVRLNDQIPSAVAVEPGKKSPLPIVLDRNGYQGAVEVQLTNLPSGVTAQPAAVPAALSSAMMTVEAKADTVQGAQLVKLLVRVNRQTIDERDLTLQVRSRRENVHFTTVDHIQLAGTLYHGWKGKNGLTVLMLHDLGRNRSSPGWIRLVEALQAEGHTVMTFDFRGHGDSKKVTPAFWNYSVNKSLPSHEPGQSAENQPRILEGASLPPDYLPWLIEDIAAARTYLDLRHDEPNGPVSTFNLVVVGAGRGSALGSLWLATEGLRYNASEMGNKILIKLPEKLSVLHAAWLGMGDPLRLGPFGIYGWLEGAHRKPVVPITFVYGQEDVDTTNLLALPIRKKFGSKFVLRGMRQSGQELLDTDPAGAAQVREYLVKRLGSLLPPPPPSASSPPVGWLPREIKKLRSFWRIPEKLPSGREEVRWYVAKRVGEASLSPVPFQQVGIPIKGLEEPTYLTDEPEQ